jgi:ABC-type branched-subunit amino acid transport system permease subunit
MRRIFVFGLLGPTLGFLMGLMTAAALGIPLFEAGVMFVMLAYAYAAGVVPAALTGLADSYFARKVRRSPRVILTAATGYVLDLAPGRYSLITGVRSGYGPTRTCLQTRSA